MSKTNKSPDFSLAVREILKGQSRMVAVEAKNFFRECFVKGGFTDRGFQPWRERTGPLGGKKILIGKGNTENLMQSIRTLEQNMERVRTGTDIPYAEIHNEGGTIVVTARMKAFWWAKYYEFAGKTRTLKSGAQSRSKANLKTNARAQFCRNMALMPIGKKIRIPKRQFIGESHALMELLDKWLISEYDKTPPLK